MFKERRKKECRTEGAVVDQITSPFNLPTMAILHIVLKDVGTAFL